MAIKSRNKVEPTFNSSSMSDLVFLLLIQTVTVYVNEQYQYFVNESPADETQLTDLINASIGNDNQATVVLRSDKSVPVQYIVNVIDAVNDINNATGNNHKVILATAPKK